MPKVDDSIDVRGPVQYNQWTQFEKFRSSWKGSSSSWVESPVRGDPERLKQLIESRGEETRAWRDEVHDGESE